MARSVFGNVLIIKRDEIIHERHEFDRVEGARKAVGLSVSELCFRASISRTAYYKWKNGRGIMPETLASIQKALAAKVQELAKKVE
jgi:transcriptional regulator with XRE-family HTH domain|tara:strand:+ start:6975 stop:7232 length:258 start_codon:yes stop_codon:yes gene_type:complete